MGEISEIDRLNATQEIAVAAEVKRRQAATPQWAVLEALQREW